MTSILCCHTDSVYKTLPDTQCFDKIRDVWTHHYNFPIVAHPPCAQWSRNRSIVPVSVEERAIAPFCYEEILRVGVGVLEHPAGSSLFRFLGVKPTLSINQSWFGFPSKKPTWLWFHNCRPLSHSISFDLPKFHSQNSMAYRKRSETTQRLAEWLIRCVHHGAVTLDEGT